MTETAKKSAGEEMCEAFSWRHWTGQESGECPNPATHMESWFDEEGVEVLLCDEHGNGNRVDLRAGEVPR